MPVVDASVVIKWFAEESDSPAAHRLLEAHVSGTEPLVAPDLLVYEVSNVLLHNRSFSLAETQHSIQRLYDIELDLISPSAEMITKTITLASAKHLSFYDALYVQLAYHFELPLYTADKKLIAKLHNSPLVRSLS